MTLEQLRIFVAVAERLHMTRAAEALHLTQSAASASVAALEARYGARLFNRVGRGLVLSDAGEAFLPEARAVLARAAAAAQALDDLAGLKRGRIEIHASQTIASYWLPPRLARFAGAHPQVTLDLHVGNTTQVARAVREGEADLGFAEGRLEDDALARTRVGADRLVVVAASDHPLLGKGLVAGQSRLTVADLLACDWVLREEGSGTRSEFQRALSGLGVDTGALAVRLALPSNEAVLGAVASGQMLSAVSDLAAAPLIAAGRVAALAIDLPERDFDLLTDRRRHRSRAAAAFVEGL
jgi:DNA-binding transcriptional LysR family regulator